MDRLNNQAPIVKGFSFLRVRMWVVRGIKGNTNNMAFVEIRTIFIGMQVYFLYRYFCGKTQNVTRKTYVICLKITGIILIGIQLPH